MASQEVPESADTALQNQLAAERVRNELTPLWIHFWRLEDDTELDGPQARKRWESLRNDRRREPILGDVFPSMDASHPRRQYASTRNSVLRTYSRSRSRDSSRTVMVKAQAKEKRRRNIEKTKELREKTDYLNAGTKRYLGDGWGQWRPITLLGEGGGGTAGLWERTNSRDSIDSVNRIVIKENQEFGDQDLTQEMETMILLGWQGTHTAKMVQTLSWDAAEIKIRSTRDRGIPFLVLEYCSGGDLSELIKRRQKKNKPFSEGTLWEFFACFRKALSLLDHSHENPVAHDPNIAPIVHFDLKPQNVFLGDRDAHHPLLPILKIGDFGLAFIFDEPYSRFHLPRRFGTEGFLTPEQFTDRWLWDNDEKWGICGRYGTPTNIWGVGGLMYSLATLSTKFPQLPGFHISKVLPHNSVVPGVTYGRRLSEANYSNQLKNLIWRCLCEMPQNRPTLAELEDRINIATTEFAYNENSENNYGHPEDWDDIMEAPEDEPSVPPPEKIRFQVFYPRPDVKWPDPIWITGKTTDTLDMVKQNLYRWRGVPIPPEKQELRRYTINKKGIGIPGDVLRYNHTLGFYGIENYCLLHVAAIERVKGELFKTQLPSPSPPPRHRQV